MVAYYKAEEIKGALKKLVHHYVEDCKKNEKLSQDFIDLIKHNFFAKFAYYNKQKQVIEVGINESKVPGATYPTINVYSFSVDDTDEWFEKSFRSGAFHLAYYGQLLSRKNTWKKSEVVVI